MDNLQNWIAAEVSHLRSWYKIAQSYLFRMFQTRKYQEHRWTYVFYPYPLVLMMTCAPKPCSPLPRSNRIASSRLILKVHPWQKVPEIKHIWLVFVQICITIATYACKRSSLMVGYLLLRCSLVLQTFPLR